MNLLFTYRATASGVLMVLLLVACKREEALEFTGPEPFVYIIPEPASMQFTGGFTDFSQLMISAAPGLENETAAATNLLREAVSLTIGNTSYNNQNARLFLELDESTEEPESYILEITPERITITGADAAGVFYGLQSLRQLIPASRGSRPKSLSVPCLRIDDGPRFSYRGMHLDVSRHFFGKEVVKRYLDVMSRYKFNYFHWHLTDDQGWRLPIDAYPKLNTISSWRDETLVGHFNDTPWKYDGKRYGGFYTKDEIREIVDYATMRHITVIPEIEIPGHSQAVLAAYPELGCTGEKIEVRKVWGISEHVLCPGEETFNFIETVLSEVMDLFPGKYIHIGGDECPKTQWKESKLCQGIIASEGLADESELQSFFIKRVEAFLSEHGRRIIGWDEILEGGLSPNATVMSWRGTEGGIAAAEQGNDVIMTPTSHCYFDYYQSMREGEPQAIGGFIPLEKVYAFNPVPSELSPDKQAHILGVQGNVWTEYIPTALRMDYMAWPRGIALAEVAWSSADKRNFTDFAERLQEHIDILRGRGVYVANRLYDLDYTTQLNNGELFVKVQKLLPEIVVHYSTDGGITYTPTDSPIRIDSSVTLIARAETRKGVVEEGLTLKINKHIGVGKPIELNDEPTSPYNTGGATYLINGIQGPENKYGDKEWCGFYGKDFIATIDLGKAEQISRVSLRCYHAPGQWIYLPERIIVLTSVDRQILAPVSEIQNPEPVVEQGAQEFVFDFDAVDARFVKLIVQTILEIPEGQQGAGNPAWLFADEIVID